MRKRTLVSLLPLTLIPSVAGADAKPLPPIVQKYIRTVQHARTLYVDVTQPGVPRTWRLILARPNRMRLTAAEAGRITKGLISDGHTVSEWNRQQYATRAAPAKIADTEAILPSLQEDVVVELIMGAMTQPEGLRAVPSVRQAGTVSRHGVPCRKVTIRPANGDVGAIWFAVATGLPSQITYTQSGKTTTLTFGHYRLDRPVTDKTFALRPPVGLAAYTPEAVPSSPRAAPALPTSESSPLLPVGTPAPDFTLRTADDAKPLRLSDFKGHPVLLDFWASWCPPCRKALPHTQALANAFGPQGLAVLAVNSWDTKSGMRTFLLAHPEYTMTVLFDDHGGRSGHRQGSVAHDLYNVTGIPTVYLIDKDGKIAASFLGYEDDTETKIRAALAMMGVQ